MSAKLKVALVSVAVITAFAFGRWLCPVKVVTKTVTVEVENKTKDAETDKNTHKQSTVTETRKPDGTTTTVTQTTEDSTSKKTVDSTDTVNKTTNTVKEVTYDTGKITVMVTYGAAFTDWHPVYGGSISKPLLGPITMGLWGNSAGAAGAAIGLTL